MIPIMITLLDKPVLGKTLSASVLSFSLVLAFAFVFVFIVFVPAICSFSDELLFPVISIFPWFIVFGISVPGSSFNSEHTKFKFVVSVVVDSILNTAPMIGGKEEKKLLDNHKYNIDRLKTLKTEQKKLIRDYGFMNNSYVNGD